MSIDKNQEAILNSLAIWKKIEILEVRNFTNDFNNWYSMKVKAVKGADIPKSLKLELLQIKEHLCPLCDLHSKTCKTCPIYIAEGMNCNQGKSTHSRSLREGSTKPMIKLLSSLITKKEKVT